MQTLILGEPKKRERSVWRTERKREVNPGEILRWNVISDKEDGEIRETEYRRTS